MSLLERLVRLVVRLRWGHDPARWDLITDYLDNDTPDYAGAWRAWRTFAAQEMQS